MFSFVGKYIVFGAALLVAGCAEIGSLGAPTPPTPALALYGGDVIAAVPEGYCIETKASKPRSGFAVMVGCGVIAGTNDRPRLNGFATVQVGPAGSAIVAEDPDGFEAFLSTTAGETLLSVNGNASTVSVGGVKQTSGAVTVRFADQAAPPVAGLQTTEWRAFVDIKGRLTTIAVRGMAETPLTASQGQALLESVLASMLANNQIAETVVET
ncbi:MAG: hypothetical protein ABJO29_02585 [Yoonia sp.]|uniref:hypothetical protein n=1 Tax=Yoonia sp. TaxID=2212373 RepID=UPI00326546FF